MDATIRVTRATAATNGMGLFLYDDEGNQVFVVFEDHSPNKGIRMMATAIMEMIPEEEFLRILTANAYMNPTEHVTWGRLETAFGHALAAKRNNENEGDQ